jgi:hypothetical protein
MIRKPYREPVHIKLKVSDKLHQLERYAISMEKNIFDCFFSSPRTPHPIAMPPATEIEIKWQPKDKKFWIPVKKEGDTEWGFELYVTYYEPSCNSNKTEGGE